MNLDRIARELHDSVTDTWRTRICSQNLCKTARCRVMWCQQILAANLFSLQIAIIGCQRVNQPCWNHCLDQKLHITWLCQGIVMSSNFGSKYLFISQTWRHLVSAPSQQLKITKSNKIFLIIDRSRPLIIISSDYGFLEEQCKMS